MKKTVIVASKRTAIGSFQGVLSSLSATDLGAKVIKDILEVTKINPSSVDEVIMGNVISAGLGQAPARQAAIFAGLPDKTECLTINKMCGSGLKSVMLANQAIMCGDADVVIAGGMESMSNAPYLVPNARNGFRLGNGIIYDSLIKDGLWDVYNNIHMGSCAEVCAKDFAMTRTEVDEFAIRSYKNAIEAIKSGKFKDEITPISISQKKGTITIDTDEEPGKVNFDKISELRPAFEKDGIVTAANASKLNDGASALLLMSEEKAFELGLTPLFEIVAQASAAKAPVYFTTAPADAITKVIKKANLQLNDIDLFEINEAFAVVSVAVNRILGLDNSKVNVNGGAIALGHPIGASGARILTTLIYEMMRRNSKLGLASLCIGGGEASALIIKKYE
ncbi:MAG: acetyl-CoA acetyltransferase [Stygiobacter sp. RIFOXYA12_FULL_38_9]|nr:MAG: acetyl-CoA acetyltransferase [Stygiobacter sp. GWC2_38_9]OGU78614.1 MAG: acetyl-CoA acetyltransferase [Stygiobacter sp. RIFOXYA12_FULL_38_9]OGV05994.1 MAG: acetyl-CoA acetyltransferase [Stygiobacter sp. RIFOXYB2_FULL_37_11]OGV11192.1 MAG: acetyl-CoA acetyltransferase [Stygiobacter sp. RIFOXYA2_FULL_38_8]OGV16943.1 MAG: acetyl-CoA acetyltransferase [Stygiobacter sp. RIFOXYC2_FULL_38_25]OGV82707.1 MAG: acetyl-CoA acetyltransferase [Stygiobacter sp. GWF2_38_21]